MDYSLEHPGSRWKLPARWYRVDLPLGAAHPLVTILMLDSNKDSLGTVRWNAELAWLEQELQSVRTGAAVTDAGFSELAAANEGHPRWLLCCAHHPLFSNGAHGDNGVLQTTWGKLFQRYHVDFYICGHDHDLQHLQVPGYDTTFLLVGGGGGGTRPMRRDNRGPFSRTSRGFLHLRLTPDHAVGRFVDEKGDELHLFDRDRAGKADVVFTTGTQKATTQPLKLIQGLDQAPRPGNGGIPDPGQG